MEKVTRLETEIAYLKNSQSLALNLESLTVKRKSEIITESRKDYKLETFLAMSQLPASVYHYHQQTRPKAYQYDVIQQEIERLHIIKHDKKAGYQLIYIELKNIGHHIGKNKVLYLMKTIRLL